MITRTLPTPKWAPGAGRVRRATFALVAAAAAVVAGAAPAAMGDGAPQVVAAAALVLAVVAAHVHSRTAGLVALWALWLLAPGIRRILGLTGPYLSADPMALAPFVATAAVALVELSRARLSGRVRGFLMLAAAGYLIGVPVGLVSPLSAVYALFAYGVGVLALLLGLADPARSDPTLRRALVAFAIPISAYAVYQYFAGLPAWDDRWLASVDFITTGAPEADRVRAFSTLNSPGTFAAIAGLAVIAYLAQRRPRAWHAVSLGLLLTALALTYVRSAWVAILAGAVAYVLFTHGRGAPRVAVGAVGCVLLVAGLGAVSSSTSAAITERFGTLGSPEEDQSANDRVNLRLHLVPEAAAQPLGRGLGTAGEATRLGASTRLQHSDNGYLALLYQVGPVGFLLVLTAILGFCGPLFRAVWRNRGRDATGVFIAAALVFLFVLLSAGDMLYGVTGIVFWYLLGSGYRWATRTSLDSR